MTVQSRVDFARSYVIASAPITDEGVDTLRSRLGVKLRARQFNHIASKDNIRKFAHGIGDGNPLWKDESQGVQSRYGTNVAPPTFLISVLAPTGMLAGGLPNVQSILTDQTWEFFLPIKRNDHITVSARLIGVEDGTNRHGERQVAQTVEVEYFNHRGERIAVGRGRSVRLERDALRARQPQRRTGSYPYTSDDLGAIEDAYDAEFVQGTKIRYWDDVIENEELPQIVRGPLGREDVEFYFAGTQSFPSYGEIPTHAARHPAAYYPNPQNGILESLTQTLLFDAVARDLGLPGASDTGSQRVAWLGNLVTNWVGDDGEMKSLQVHLSRFNQMGDTQWCRGHVAGKRVVDGRHLVDLSLRCENQVGEITATGSATVELRSRNV